MREEPNEQIERWANFIKLNKDWKKHHTPFIDAQINKANKFYKELSKTKKGREKIKLLRI